MTIEFEKVLVKYLEQNKTKRPTHKINKTLGIYGGDTVDSIEYYSKELKMLERLIYQQRSEPSDHFHLDGSAFVLFKSINACHRSEERIGNALSRNHLVQIFTTTPDLRLCPDIDDLVWENVGNSALEKRSRKLLAVGLTIGLTLGWFLLESLVQGASAFLTSFGDSPIPSNFRGLVTVYKSIITPSLLAGLNILLFLVLKYISKLQGVVTESGIERSALLKYFVFQIYRLLISVSASAVFAYAALFFSGQASNAQFNDLLGDLTKAAIRVRNILSSKVTYFLSTSIRVSLSMESLLYKQLPSF